MKCTINHDELFPKMSKKVYRIITSCCYNHNGDDLFVRGATFHRNSSISLTRTFLQYNNLQIYLFKSLVYYYYIIPIS